MKVQLPWAGKATGNSAGLIYQSYWGRTFARTFPAIFHYPDTKLQQITQAKFHDIRRIWDPIYRNISQYIGRGQRTNRNTYNDYLQGLYRAFNPYNEVSKSAPPRSWGIDPLNRMSVELTEFEVINAKEQIFVQWTSLKLVNKIAAAPTRQFFLLLNLTRQALYFDNAMYLPYRHSWYFINQQDWREDDKILFYTALAAKDWLGNFNLVKQ